MFWGVYSQVQGKEVPLGAKANAFLPPEGLATQWYRIE